MKKLFLFLLCGLLPLALIISCDSDSGNDGPPATGILNGSVIFHGDWPDSGTVQVSIFTNWNNEGTNCYWCAQSAGGPPAYWTPSTHFQDPDPSNQHEADTLGFQISGITFGDYEVCVAGWRRPVASGHGVECDEPVIGMYGADPATSDTIPSSLNFSDSNPTQNIVMHAYFSRIPDCGEVTTGTITGSVTTDGAWPDGGLLAMLTTTPITGWRPPFSAPSGYYPMQTEDQNVYEFEVGFGTYYVSVWTNAQPPAPVLWFGSYGLNTPAGDIFPDAITLSESSPTATNIDIMVNSPAPHFIAGSITFNGTRPAEGLLALLSTFPYSPEHPPTGAPSGYFPITDNEQTQYAFNNIPLDTYYVSLWSNTPPPGTPTFFGAYGYTAGSDTDPDPVALTETASGWGAAGVDITNTAP